MFYSQDILQKKNGKFGILWLAATCDTKLGRRDYHKVNIIKSCKEISAYLMAHHNIVEDRLSLYLSSQLMFGVVKVYSVLQKHFLEDVLTLTRKCKNMFLNQPCIDLPLARHELHLLKPPAYDDEAYFKDCTDLPDADQYPDVEVWMPLPSPNIPSRSDILDRQASPLASLIRPPKRAADSPVGPHQVIDARFITLDDPDIVRIEPVVPLNDFQEEISIDHVAVQDKHYVSMWNETEEIGQPRKASVGIFSPPRKASVGIISPPRKASVGIISASKMVSERETGRGSTDVGDLMNELEESIVNCPDQTSALHNTEQMMGSILAPLEETPHHGTGTKDEHIEHHPMEALREYGSPRTPEAAHVREERKAKKRRITFELMPPPKAPHVQTSVRRKKTHRPLKIDHKIKIDKKKIRSNMEHSYQTCRQMDLADPSRGCFGSSLDRPYRGDVWSKRLLQLWKRNAVSNYETGMTEEEMAKVWTSNQGSSEVADPVEAPVDIEQLANLFSPIIDVSLQSPPPDHIEENVENARAGLSGSNIEAPRDEQFSHSNVSGLSRSNLDMSRGDLSRPISGLASLHSDPSLVEEMELNKSLSFERGREQTVETGEMAPFLEPLHEISMMVDDSNKAKSSKLLALTDSHLSLLRSIDASTHSKASTTFKELVPPGTSRKLAASSFSALLDLCVRSRVAIEQPIPYGDITIYRGKKW